MTYPERNMGPGGTPGQFEALIQSAFGENGGALMEAKLRGYKGPMGEKAFGWRQRGLGVEIGAQTSAFSANTSVDQSGGQNQVLFYALRLPESITNGERMRLAVFFTEYTHSTAVVKVRESASTNKYVKKNENLAYEIDFDQLFRPQDEPDSPPTLIPVHIKHPQQNAWVTTFQDNLDVMPFVHTRIKNYALNSLLDEAVKYEEELKQQREQGGTQVSTEKDKILESDSIDLTIFDALEDLDGSPGFDEDVEAMYGLKHHDLGKLDTELDLQFLTGELDKRFPGPMGDEIEAMDKQGGAIRIISAIQSGDVPYRVMTAAIRLNDAENGDPRHALIFTKVDMDEPGNLEKSFDVRVVRPKRAAPDADGRARAEAEDARMEYHMMLEPTAQQSPHPYESNLWETTPTETPLKSFERNLDNLPFVIDTVTVQTAAQVKIDVINRVLMYRTLRGFTSGDIWNDFGQQDGGQI